LDRLQAMQTFAAIVHGGSLTAAAEALDCSLPTVVRVLATLESHLGARLLRRTTRTMSLTGEGERYLRSCQRILADIDDAERDVLDAMQDPQGVIHMTAPVLFGQMHVAPLVCEFLSLYTKASINLTLLDRTIDLVDDGVDLALRIGPLRDSSMVALPAGLMRRVVCASPTYLANAGTPRKLSDLSTHRAVLFHQDTVRSAWQFIDAGRTHVVRMHARLTCNHAAAAAQACADNLGLGPFVAYQVEPLVRDGGLRIVLAQFEQPVRPVSLLYPQTRHLSRRLRILLDFLQPRLHAHLEAISAAIATSNNHVTTSAATQ
jgi:DNA-binding transcriptional LysR family regulator